MKSLAALGLAAAIMQFVDFSSRLITSSWDVYRDATGQGKDLKDFNIILSDFTKCMAPIRRTLRSPASKKAHGARPLEVEKLESELRPLCVTCDRVARELEKILPKTIRSLNASAKSEGLATTAQPRPSPGARFHMALEQYWNREKVEALGRELRTVHQEVMSLITVSIWLTTRDLPQSLQAFSEKQEELMVLMREKLEEGQRIGPADDLDDHYTSDLIKASVMKSDFFEHAETQLFQRDRKPGPFTFESFSGYSNYDPEIAAQSVARWLSFDYSSHRETAILDPYADTYAWALDYPLLSDSGEPKWSNFPQWLASRNKDEERIPFWITGKPGSGKSTMLKFLAQHEDTKKHLEEWATDHSLEILTYYAWSPGSSLAKSKEGLLRTFLEQILRRHPNLAPIICPRQWEHAFYVRGFFEYIIPESPLWALEESFDKFLSLEPGVFKFKVAMFIDGLDEFQEAPQEFAELVQQLASHPLVKVCVASREWKEFNYALRASPKIRMHDLTEDAIREYVAGRFKDPSVLPRVERLQKLVTDGTSRIDRLMDSILSNASGVFLWVTLVTNVIIRKLAEQEPLDAVTRTLEAMPPEMEGLYDAILDSIPATLLPSTAWTLLFFRAKLVPVDNSSHIFYLADESRGTRLKNVDEVVDGHVILAEVEDRLAVRTRGILRQSGASIDLVGHPLGSVNAVHRTAAEWLDQTHVLERLKSSAGVLQFHASYLWALVALLQSLPPLPRDLSADSARPLRSRYDEYMQSFVAHASHAEHQELETSTLIQTMEELFGGLSLLVFTYSYYFPMVTFLKHHFKKTLRRPAIFTSFVSLESSTSLSYIAISQKHIEALELLLEEGLAQRTAEDYVDGLFSTATLNDDVAREAFDELIQRHFGSTRKTIVSNARRWSKRLGLSKQAFDRMPRPRSPF